MSLTKLSAQYKKFIETYYHQIPNVTISKEKLRKINRCIWYCNISSELINDLQKYNSTDDSQCYPVNCDSEDEDSDSDSDSELSDNLLSVKYFKKGYCEYNVYRCGHCFYYIYMLSEIFDKLRQQNMIGSSDKETKEMINKITECPFCLDLAHSHRDTDQSYIYYQFNGLCCGTINLQNIIPKKYLHRLGSVFSAGDIIDTNGYRGLGLYIYDDNEFDKLKTEEYYSIITSYIASKYSYIKILNNLASVSFSGQPAFDKLHINYNTYVGCYGDTAFGDNNKSIKFDCVITKNNHTIHIFSTSDAIIKLSKNNFVKTIDRDIIVIISNTNVSFTNIKVKNNTLVIGPYDEIACAPILHYLNKKCGYDLKIELNNKEYMFIDQKFISICTKKDDNIAYKFEYNFE